MNPCRTIQDKYQNQFSLKTNMLYLLSCIIELFFYRQNKYFLNDKSDYNKQQVTINLRMIKFKTQRSLSQTPSRQKHNIRNSNQHEYSVVNLQQSKYFIHKKSKPQVARIVVQQVVLGDSGTSNIAKMNIFEKYAMVAIVKMLENHKYNRKKQYENSQDRACQHKQIQANQSRQFPCRIQNMGKFDRKFYSQQHFRSRSSQNAPSKLNIKDSKSPLFTRTSIKSIQDKHQSQLTSKQKGSNNIFPNKDDLKQKRSQRNSTYVQDQCKLDLHKINKSSHQLINPCSQGFKYCINNNASNKLKYSLLSHDYLLEPCKISPFVLQKRPCTTMDNSFICCKSKKGNTIMRGNSNRKMPQQFGNNFLLIDNKNRRYLRNGMANYLEQLRNNRKKSLQVSLIKGLPGQNDIQPWQGIANQHGEPQNLDTNTNLNVEQAKK